MEILEPTEALATVDKALGEKQLSVAMRLLINEGGQCDQKREEHGS
jgi:hypothetical protein